MATEEDSQAIKAVLRQLKKSLKEPDWKRWREKHEDIAPVRALTLEIENEEDAMNSRGEISRIETQKEHFAKANMEMEELYQMLTNDTAAGDNKMAAIMEQKISIQEHFQPKDEHGNCVPLIGADGKSGYEDVLPSQVMGLIAEEWSVAIKKYVNLRWIVLGSM